MPPSAASIASVELTVVQADRAGREESGSVRAKECLDFPCTRLIRLVLNRWRPKSPLSRSLSR